MALRCTVTPRGLQDNLHSIAIGRGGSPPHPHSPQTCPVPLRPSHSMCLTNHQPSSCRPPALLPLHHHMARPFTGRHAVPYPMTRKWNSSSTRTWGRPPLHIDALASLLMPWSAFPMRDHVGLPRSLSLPSLPTKANFNPDQVPLRLRS